MRRLRILLSLLLLGGMLGGLAACAAPPDPTRSSDYDPYLPPAPDQNIDPRTGQNPQGTIATPDVGEGHYGTAGD